MRGEVSLFELPASPMRSCILDAIGLTWRMEINPKLDHQICIKSHPVVFPKRHQQNMRYL
jgi:hypothetical protein